MSKNNSIFNLNKTKNQLKENKGKLIAVEGIDGSGKTTLIKNIMDELKEKGYKVKYISTSGEYNEFWRQINYLVNNKIIDLNTNQLIHTLIFVVTSNNLISNKLSDYDYIITDWYYYGKIILAELYSGTKHNSTSIYLKKLREQNLINMPDFYYYINIDPRIAHQRIIKRNNKPEEKENLEMLNKAHDLWNSLSADDIIIINGDENPEKLCNKLIKNILKEDKSEEILL